MRKKTVKCMQCEKRAPYHTTEHDLKENELKTFWFCLEHKPPYDLKYVPQEGEPTFKKFIDVKGINRVAICSENGNSI